jgi:hypothetical protein
VNFWDTMELRYVLFDQGLVPELYYFLLFKKWYKGSVDTLIVIMPPAQVF